MAIDLLLFSARELTEDEASARSGTQERARGHRAGSMNTGNLGQFDVGVDTNVSTASSTAMGQAPEAAAELGVSSLN